MGLSEIVVKSTIIRAGPADDRGRPGAVLLTADTTPHHTLTHCQAPRLGPVLESARNAGTEIAIIDTAPHASDATLAAAKTADLVLIPCCASVADLDAIGASVDLAKITATIALAAITKATVGSTLIAEARDAIAGYAIACAPVVVHNRLDHVRGFTEGLTAEEYAPAGKAASEVGEFWNWIRFHGGTRRGESQ